MISRVPPLCTTVSLAKAPEAISSVKPLLTMTPLTELPGPIASIGPYWKVVDRAEHPAGHQLQLPPLLTFASVACPPDHSSVLPLKRT